VAGEAKRRSAARPQDYFGERLRRNAVDYGVDFPVAALRRPMVANAERQVMAVRHVLSGESGGWRLMIFNAQLFRQTARI
jgi:hypothetical protein